MKKTFIILNIIFVIATIAIVSSIYFPKVKSGEDFYEELYGFNHSTQSELIIEELTSTCSDLDDSSIDSQPINDLVTNLEKMSGFSDHLISKLLFDTELKLNNYKNFDITKPVEKEQGILIGKFNEYNNLDYEGKVAQYGKFVENILVYTKSYTIFLINLNNYLSTNDNEDNITLYNIIDVYAYCSLELCENYSEDYANDFFDYFLKTYAFSLANNNLELDNDLVGGKFSSEAMDFNSSFSQCSKDKIGQSFFKIQKEESVDQSYSDLFTNLDKILFKGSE